VSYSLGAARWYFNLFGPALLLPNTLDRAAYLRLLRLAKIEEGHSVIDLGAGIGSLADLMIRRSPAPGRVVLVELSDTNLAILRRRFRGHLGRVSVLPVRSQPPYELPEASFDRIFCCFVLEMMDRENQLQQIDEAYRLLRHGGQMCCMTVTRGRSLVTRISMLVAEGLSHISQWLVLGAQFGELRPLFDEAQWAVHEDAVSSMGFQSAILVAT
jgi:ubiquinone/menaquinone biosynthesis C-methylase UbiE